MEITTNDILLTFSEEKELTRNFTRQEIDFRNEIFTENDKYTMCVYEQINNQRSLLKTVPPDVFKKVNYEKELCTHMNWTLQSERYHDCLVDGKYRVELKKTKHCNPIIDYNRYLELLLTDDKDKINVVNVFIQYDPIIGIKNLYIIPIKSLIMYVVNRCFLEPTTKQHYNDHGLRFALMSRYTRNMKSNNQIHLCRKTLEEISSFRISP